MKNTKLIIILVIGLMSISIISYTLYQSNINTNSETSSKTSTKLENQANITNSDIFSIENTSTPGLKKFVSNTLGVSFTYLEDQGWVPAGKVMTTQLGNKIYLANVPDELIPNSSTISQTLEVLKKSKDINLEDSIKKDFAADTSCNWTVIKNEFDQPGFVFAYLSTGVEGDNLEEMTIRAQQCGVEHNDVFFYDTSHPEKYFRAKIGQDPIMTIDKKLWINSIEVLK